MFVYFVRAMELTNYRPIVRLTFVGWSVDYTLTGTNEGMCGTEDSRRLKLIGSRGHVTVDAQKRP